MYARLKSVASNMLSLAGAGALLFGLSASDAQAQKFEYTYGGPLCSEAGRGGVQQVSQGGYITAGESFSPEDCATSDIYIVRTNNDGSLAWSQTYDIGGNDSAADVQEVVYDPEGRG